MFIRGVSTVYQFIFTKGQANQYLYTPIVMLKFWFNSVKIEFLIGLVVGRN